MVLHRTPRGTAKAGFSLVEMAAATVIFVMIAYMLSTAVGVGRDSHQAVLQAVTGNEQLRESASRMRRELKSSSDDVITITALGDANHQLTFQMPVDDAGDPSWGVFDRAWGTTAAEQNQVDWSIRYTVQAVPVGDGQVERQLVRQVLDDLGAVQEEEVIVTGLRRGDEAPPGFTMVQAGDLWEITLTTVGYAANTRGRGFVFHVQTRN